MEKLKERIDKMYPNRAEFAKALGVDPSVLSRMLANGNWKADKIKLAVELLKIPIRDIPTYFFATTVAKSGTEEKGTEE